MADRVERLRLYEPKDLVPMGVRSAGTDIQPIQVEGNSILSLVYIHTISAGTSVSVQYYDSGSGTNLGEFNLVGQHPSLIATGSNRVLITRITNKANLKWTVTGPGTAHFGVYAFVVSSFASDLDQALKLQGTVADLLNDKGLVTMGYDATSGEFYFLPMEAGRLLVSGDFEVPGDPKLVSSTAGLVTTPTVQQTLINHTIPSGETWRVREVVVNCRAYATFDILADSVRIGSGRTGPATPNVRVIMTPYQQVLATKIVEINFLETVGPVVDVDAYIWATKN